MVILNKKGMDISLNFIILAVLALIALIVIALFFTGGLTNLFGQTEDVGSISAEKIALYSSKCKFYCTTGDEASWLNPRFEDETLKGKSCENADSILKHGKKLTDSDSDGETDDCVNV